MATVTGVTPTSGSLGTTITVLVTGLVPDPGFHSIAYMIDNVTGIGEYARPWPSGILLDRPQTLPGFKNFRVLDATGMSNTIIAAFEFFALPTLNNPAPASAGEVVALSGTNFTAGATVTVDGVPATYVFISSTSATIVMPTLTTGLGSKTITMTTGGGVANASIEYEGSVRIISVTPSTLVQFVATPLAIVGAGFSSDVSVVVDPDGDSKACTSIVVVNSSNITCVSPRLEAGSHTIEVSSPTDGSGDAALTVIAAPLLRGAGLIIKARAAPPSPPAAADDISVRATRASTRVPELAEPPKRRPNDFDASAAGRAVSKCHYFQGFDQVEIMLAALAAGHDGADSVISLAGFKSAVLKSVSIEVEADTDPVTSDLMAHGGDLWTAFQRLQSPEQVDDLGNVLSFPNGDTAFVRVGLAFDDARIYAVHQYLLGLPNGIDDFVATLNSILFKPTAAALTPIGARNYANPALENFSWGPEAYQRERDNGIKLTALMEAEHDIGTGNHRVPLDKFNGFATAFDATVSAPGSVGGIAHIEIEAAGTDRLYVAPALVPAAGAGIIQAAMAFSRTKTYVALRRLTAGTTNDVRLGVFRISTS